MTFATKNKTKMTSDELTAVVVNNYLIIDLSIQIILSILNIHQRIPLSNIF